MPSLSRRCTETSLAVGATDIASPTEILLCSQYVDRLWHAARTSAAEPGCGLKFAADIGRSFIGQDHLEYGGEERRVIFGVHHATVFVTSSITGCPCGY